MANTITTTGRYTISLNGSVVESVIGDMGTTFVNTGSNVLADNITVVSASAWTPIPTSSLANLEEGFYRNYGTASIIIAGSSDGTNVKATLRPGKWAKITFAQSSIAAATLFANVIEATSGSVLRYINTER